MLRPACVLGGDAELIGIGSCKPGARLGRVTFTSADAFACEANKCLDYGEIIHDDTSRRENFATTVEVNVFNLKPLNLDQSG
jgi:hypothetical protein